VAVGILSVAVAEGARTLLGLGEAVFMISAAVPVGVAVR
jgi:hypothetical protein